MENLAWIDKDRFYDSLKELKREELPEEIIIGLDVLETAISTSTVGALALFEESAESSVAAAIALRLYKIDWTETRDPNAGKAMLRIAETLQKNILKLICRTRQSFSFILRVSSEISQNS